LARSVHLQSMEYKIVVVGGGGVGKSAITVQFISHHFVESYDPTIEDSYRKQKHVDGEVAHIFLLDTAGQEEYSCMTEMWLRGANGYLVAYSVTSNTSLHEANNYLQKIERIRDCDLNGFAITIFGNKCDLEEQREVPPECGRKLAQKYGIAFFEGSAKLRTNIDEAFDEIVRRIRKETKPTLEKKLKKKKCTIL